MFRKAYVFLSIAAASILAYGASSGYSESPPVNQSAAQLLDPIYMTARVCGKSSESSRQFKNRLALAMAANKTGYAAPSALPPLFSGLDRIHFKISTSSPQAQRYFDQGFALTYGFNHWEAIRAFKAAQSFDPSCAICYWGEALAWGPNINLPMQPEAVLPAWQALQKALELKNSASPREQALITALETRYSIDPATDRAELDAAFAVAMSEVVAQFPADDDIAVLYVESVMDTMPWVYWDASGRNPNGRAGDALAKLEKVLERNPDHPAAIHLYIHMTEASSNPYRAEAAADRLGSLVPGSGHLVHMPSHIYYRIGRFADSISVNIRATKVDEDYLAQVDAIGFYPAGYYPHNVHFVTTSAQMAGDAATALEYGAKLDRVLLDDMVAEVPVVQPIKSAPLFVHAQFSDANTILSLKSPDQRLAYVVAMWHHIRALALADLGRFDEAEEEIAAMSDIRLDTDFSIMVEQAVPAPDLIEIAELVARARIAARQEEWEEAILTLEEAAALEQTIPYMEPPYWYYPIRQSLGAAYLSAGQADAAIQAFKEALVSSPNNGWVLYGLMQAQKALGDLAGAKASETALAKAWVGHRSILSLDRL